MAFEGNEIDIIDLKDADLKVSAPDSGCCRGATPRRALRLGRASLCLTL
jgi:hypothetical protein